MHVEKLTLKCSILSVLLLAQDFYYFITVEYVKWNLRTFSEACFLRGVIVGAGSLKRSDILVSIRI